MAPPNVELSERLNTRNLLMLALQDASPASAQNATLPRMLPPAPPVPSTSTPSLMVVPPV